MYPHHDEHAASVPVTVAHLSVVYCHFCQAWRVNSWLVTSLGEQDGQIHHQREQDLGPFDTEFEVLPVIMQHAAALLSAPGTPWVPGLP